MTQNDSDKWEQDIRDLLVGMKFKDPTEVGRITGGGFDFQLDASGGTENKYLIIDATISRDFSSKLPFGSKKKIRKFKKRIKQIKKRVNRFYNNKYHSFEVLIWTKFKHIPIKLKKRAGKLGVRILGRTEYEILKNRIESLESQEKTNVQRAILRYWLLKWIESETPKIRGSSILDLAAIKYQYSKKEYAYNFSISPNLLLKMCYVLSREATAKPGYQRLLDESRVDNIRKYILSSKTGFPNNIILNFPEKDNNIKEISCKESKNEGIYFCRIRLPDRYCSSQIIDGQHRLYGFMDIKNNFITKNLKISATAFNKLSDSKSGKIFIDLNKNQKKIPANLFWDLVGDYLPLTYEGKISQIVKKIANCRMFNDKIYIPGGKGSSSADITIANFCNSINNRYLIRGYGSKKSKKNIWNFYYRSDKKINKTVENTSNQIILYYQVIQDIFPTEWKSFVFTNMGIDVMLRLLAEILKFYNKKHPTKFLLSRSDFDYVLSTLKNYLKNKNKKSYIEDLLRRSSEGTRGIEAEKLMRIINKSINDFAYDHLKNIDERRKLDELKEKKKQLVSKIKDIRRRTTRKKNLYKELIKTCIKLDQKKETKKWNSKMKEEFPRSRSITNN